MSRQAVIRPYDENYGRQYNDGLCLIRSERWRVPSMTLASVSIVWGTHVPIKEEENELLRIYPNLQTGARLEAAGLEMLDLEGRRGQGVH